MTAYEPQRLNNGDANFQPRIVITDDDLFDDQLPRIETENFDELLDC